jgi:hypothetical protein
LGLSSAQPHFIRKSPFFPPQDLLLAAFISTTTNKEPKIQPPSKAKMAPQQGGNVVEWKDGTVSSALGGAEKTKKSFKEKTHQKSIGVGMEMAMSLLGKLH